MAMMEKAHRLRRRVHGDEHPLVASDLSNMALMHADRDRLAVAVPLMRRALDLQASFLNVP